MNAKDYTNQQELISIDKRLEALGRLLIKITDLLSAHDQEKVSSEVQKLHEAFDFTLL